MGFVIKVDADRTLVALVLVGAAVALPMAAWFVTGQHKVQLEAERAMDEPRRMARETSGMLALRLAARLEALRETEDRRPFYHYQNLFHDPKGAYEGASVIPSPLAQGPQDPLVRAYFTVDAGGVVTMPTLNPDVPENNAPDFELQKKIQTELTAVGPACRVEIEDLYAQLGITPENYTANGVALPQTVVVADLPAQAAGQVMQNEQAEQQGEVPQQRQAQGPPPVQSAEWPQQGMAVPQSEASNWNKQEQRLQAQVSTLGNRAWQQNLYANELYQELQKRGGKGEPATKGLKESKGSKGAKGAKGAKDSTSFSKGGPTDANSPPPNPAPPLAEAAVGPTWRDDPMIAQGVKKVKGVKGAVDPPLLAELGAKGKPGWETFSRSGAVLPPNLVEEGVELDTEVTILKGPLLWRTIRVEGEDQLVALRQVRTPVGNLTQGILFDKQSIKGWLAGAAFPADLTPGLPASENEAWVPLSGTAWRVRVDASETFTLGAKQAEALQAGFYWTFMVGAVIALVAGGCVVVLVWHSDRLARQRAQFAASAAHELRTPLAGLRMYGEMLADGLGDPAKSKTYARRIADEAARLGRVVSNMLNFTRLERGVLAVQPAPGDLGAAVRESIERFAPGLEAMGAPLSCAVDEGLPRAMFDREAVEQILQNLVDNAEKYARSSAGRAIQVSVKRAPGGEGVEISVRDHGPGLDAKLLPQLFRPFTRGSDRDAPAGLGLGLALTRALVDAQGGAIRAENAAGGGALFVVRLPQTKT